MFLSRLFSYNHCPFKNSTAIHCLFRRPQSSRHSFLFIMKRSAQQVCTMRYEERTIAGEGPVHHIAIPGWSPRDQLLQMAWGTLKAVYDRIEYCRRVSMVAEYEPRPFELEPARSRVTPLPAAACTSRPNKLPGGDTFREFLAWLQRNPTGGSYIRMQMEIDAVALGATTDRADRLPPPSPNGLDDLLESLSLVNASFAMFVKVDPFTSRRRRFEKWSLLYCRDDRQNRRRRQIHPAPLPECGACPRLGVEHRQGQDARAQAAASHSGRGQGRNPNEAAGRCAPDVFGCWSGRM